MPHHKTQRPSRLIVELRKKEGYGRETARDGEAGFETDAGTLYLLEAGKNWGEMSKGRRRKATRMESTKRANGAGDAGA